MDLQEDVQNGSLDATEIPRIMNSDREMSARSARRSLAARKYSQRILLPAHLGLKAFGGLSLDWFSDRYEWSLYQVVSFMKEKNALNPTDRLTPLSSAEEVLRQFL